jgi:integrase
LHGYALAWVDRYSGSGRDNVREHTPREYRRLLVTFARRYFDRELQVRDVDRAAVQHFVDWLIAQPGRKGRLSDRSVANALTPLRAVLGAAVADGLLAQNPVEGVVLPRRRGGRAYEFQERRFLTREELARLLNEVPPKWRALFELLGATGLRISEAIALRWSDLHLDASTPHLRISRAIVRGVVGAPKSRHGARLVPLPDELARRSAHAGRTMPRMTRSSSPDASGRRPTLGVCGGASSCPPLSAQACPASAFTRCATRARRC